jgi:hypothetical protein
MRTLNVMGVTVAVTKILALVGIAEVAVVVAPLLLVQSASATTDVMTGTTTSVGGGGGGGGEQEVATSTTTTTTANNISNAVLGSLFLTGQDRLTSFNRINETYTEVSYVGNRTIMSPDAPTTATINATET